MSSSSSSATELQPHHPRVIAWVNKKDFTVSRMELYDGGNKLWKSSEIKNEQVQGYWTPMEIKMTDVTKSHTTIMKITKIEYDKNLEDLSYRLRRVINK